MILAGGAASRFGGRPKGLEVVGGTRILDRLVAEFELALGEIPLLVANDPEAGGWRADMAVVTDTAPGLGALGGLWTAVTAGPAPVVVAAWDMPFVTAGLLIALADGLEGHDACLPASGGPRGSSRSAPPTGQPVRRRLPPPLPGATSGRSDSIGTSGCTYFLPRRWPPRASRRDCSST